MKTRWSLLLCALLLAACERNERLARALELAGENRAELEKVLQHYEDDTLKHKAACFLIENMAGKYARVPEDPEDAYRAYLNRIPKKDSAFWDAKHSLVWLGLDSIGKGRKPGGTSRREDDLTRITGDYLIRNIDAAFAAWEQRDSAHRCTFADFCRYVLPYRMGDEPLSDWRTEAREKYAHLLDSALTDRELAVRITQLRDIHYNIGMTRYPHPMTYAEMLLARWGTCDDMAAYLALSLRALGIPATIDFVPAWANRSSGHCWNVMPDEEGNWQEVGFGDEGKNEVVYKPSKIYRKSYDNAMLDVTATYAMPLSALTFPTEEKAAALCTFNNAAWVPVAFAAADSGRVSFASVGRGALWGENRVMEYCDEGKGIVYLPVALREGRAEVGSPVHPPVILYEDGTVRPLPVGATDGTEAVTLTRKYPYYTAVDEDGDGKDSNNVMVGDTYELRYWGGKWMSLGRQTAETDTLHYESVPRGALLWLHNHTRGREERIFTYENGKQVWW